MVSTSKKLYSFEEYLKYDDGTERRYKLVDGELLEVPPATGRHAKIARFLLQAIRSRNR